MLIVTAVTTGRKRARIIPAVIVRMMVFRLPANTMTDPSGSVIFFILPLDKCGQVWYNKSGPTMAVPGPNFQKVKSFRIFFCKILLSSPHAHFPEIVHLWRTRTSVRFYPFEAIGNPRITPIWASFQLNGPPRVGADRTSDR